ncbi:glycosyl hydrolase family 18 protein [Psychromonas ossibalaenae]|uniref:glycosyl hydrolase family 18 protein n=1 Tax=Psychromonas ossibalaenae TaxID=444922 RepID=UPI000366949F|nr:glycosyl hydrolase family 18 protein [Psychromonas ossibalaenae]
MFTFSPAKKAVSIALLSSTISLFANAAETVTPYIAGETTVANGDIVSYNGDCFQAKNSPGLWETPSTASWFWDAASCGDTPVDPVDPTPVPGDVPEFIAGTTNASNGDIYSYNNECFQAKNNPGIWEAPKAGSWFWEAVDCPSGPVGPVCEEGSSLVDGQCVVDVVDPVCEEGSSLVNGECVVDVVDPACEEGSSLVDGQCVVDVVDPVCEEGSSLVDGLCVVDAVIPGTDEACRPAGLYATPGVDVPYCSVYDADGREIMGADHPRRIIGYFTSWRNGANGQPSFLASDIPWDSITHINYAFAHINKSGEVSIGDTTDPKNPATGMTWEGAENAMDPSLPYKGHFNLLNQYAKKHDVKLLLSVGGWAETGAHFDDAGRYMDGGFYSLTIKEATGEVNYAAIDKFAKSAAVFVNQYGFDGIDIDYEYPSSMSDAGHPEDWAISNKHRGKLFDGYMALMEALRRELDQQGAADQQHYMLTIASPSSGYLLRGFRGFQALQYLDYVNIMSYDLHGAWNHFAGHNAALYDNGVDNEIADAGIYSGNDAKYYNGQGYLNIDWSYKYFRTALQGGRINIGLPYYTRGFQQVQGGTNGLNGLAALPNQSECYLGTGGNLGPDALSPKAGAPCGYGAQGIDNLWFDADNNGNEMFAGASPIWHVNNLRDNLPTPYVNIYGHDTTTAAAQYTGDYVEHYDELAQASWLWNEEKKVFLSTENMKSYKAKVQYAIDQGAGGIMFWEMAGDYSTPEQNGKGYYYFGSTLTDTAYNMIKTAAPYGVKAGDENFIVAQETVDVDVDLVGYLPKGEDNYPIQVALKLTNNSEVDLSGAKIAFNVSPAVPMNAQISDTLKPYAVPSGNGIVNLVDMYSGVTWSVDNLAETGLSMGNVGGLSNDFHRFGAQLKADGWGSVKWLPGETISIAIRLYMPMPVPTNFTFEIAGKTYGRTAEK